MHITAEDAVKLGVADIIIPEADGGAHNDMETTAENIQENLLKD